MKSLQRVLSTDYASLLFWVAVFVAVLAIGTGVSYGGVAGGGILILLALGVPMALWFLKDHRVGLTIAILSIVPGNLVRLSLGTDTRGGAAILICDIVIPILAAVWFIKKMVRDKKFPATPVNAPYFVFTLIALISLVQGIFLLDRLGTFNLKDAVIAFLYWARWVEYGLLFFITLDTVRTLKDVTYFLRVLLLGAVLISVGGFIQLIYYPDFTMFAILYGWDPHQDRLLSTFFDPNFVGGFLAFVIAIVMGLFFSVTENRKKTLYLLLAVVLAVALVLTFSRSGYLALLAAGVVIGVLRSRVALVFGILASLLVLLMVPRALNRVTEGLSVDETGVKRIQSWTKALSIVPAYPLLGTGYNTFGTIQETLGTVDEFDVNNKSGVENSFLTVLVTTGIVGFAAFAYLYLAICRSLYRNWKNRALADRWRGLNLGVMAGVIGLMFHSLFVHSLMYPFILVYFWVFIALALKSVTINTHEA